MAAKKSAGHDASAEGTSMSPRPGTEAPTGHPASIASRSARQIGVVRHYYGQVKAAIFSIHDGMLQCGDVIHVRGHTTDFCQRVDHMEIDRVSVEVAHAGVTVGVQVTQAVRKDDGVFLLSN